MTESEITDRLLGSIKAAVALLRHGHHSEAAAVLDGAAKSASERLAEWAAERATAALGGVSGDGLGGSRADNPKTRQHAQEGA